MPHVASNGLDVKKNISVEIIECIYKVDPKPLTSPIGF